VLLAASGSQGAAPSSYGLETVFPMTPGQNNVRWWTFDWKWTDFAPIEGAAPVRLYFYEAEREVAKRAKPAIAAAYLDLAMAFDYTPSQAIPFLLYNSHFEFQSTTAFPISEGVLGVTSTQDLTMALPYWGEHARFQHVMRHELAHQFTIQEVRDKAAGACNPLELIPLWFIEGVAEFYSQKRLTPDARGLIADSFLEAKKGEAIDGKLPRFFDFEPMTFERVYLLGHAQVRFLEETYGAGTVQRILDNARKMCGDGSFFSSYIPFAAYLAALLGTTPDAIQRQYESWTRAVAEPGLKAAQGFAGMQIADDLGVGEIDSISVSPDGATLLYRTLELDTGISRLYLRDHKDRGSRVRLAEDNSLGMVSLHPRDRRVTAIGENLLVYIGRVGATDHIFIREYRRKVDADGEIDYEFGREIEHDIGRYFKLIEAGYPAIEPGTGKVAFIGLNRDSGLLDVYRLERPFDVNTPLAQLTNDAYAEQGLAYDTGGALYLVSDKTADGRYELFQLRHTGERDGKELFPDKVLLTNFPDGTDVMEPESDRQGGIYFTSGHTGFKQVYRYGPRGIVRVTDVPTSASYPAPGDDGSMLLIVVIDGVQQLVRMPAQQLLSLPVEQDTSIALVPWTIPYEDLGRIEEYEPYAIKNYSLAGAQLFATGGLLAGNVVFTDVFKGRVAGLTAQWYSLDRIDTQAIFIDRAGRWGKGGALFLRNGISIEPDSAQDDLDIEEAETFLLQRYGGSFILEYPYSRYLRSEFFISPQAIRAFDFSAPGNNFADDVRGTYPALELGSTLGFDTLRRSFFGPIDGSSAMLKGSVTGVLGGSKPFGRLNLDLQRFHPLIRGYERLLVYGRAAGGMSLGGVFNEQYYIPAAYNLRAVSDGSLATLGEHYAFAQLNIEFPLTPVLGGMFYLQGVIGGDIGAISFDPEGLRENRIAAAVGGVNLGLGGLTLRFHMAHPYDIGGREPEADWLLHVSIGLLPFML
jgi:hypothetical protein